MRLANLILAVTVATGASLWLAPTPDSLEQSAEESILRDGSTDASSALLRKALAADPASPHRWCTLAEELARTGHNDQARYCFERAVQLGPHVPPVLMRAANFHFDSGHIDEGLRCTGRILALVRDYDAVIFSTWRRMAVSVPAILDHALPRAAREPYFASVLADGDPDAAASVWHYLESTGGASADQRAAYSRFVLAQRDFHSAAGLGLARLRNPGFETDLMPGLDWELTPCDGITIDRVRSSAHSGAAALRLTFDGSANPECAPLTQTIVVAPGSYRFRAFLRSEQLTTDQGLAFRIFDAEAPSRLDVTTRQLTGTAGWTELSAIIDVRAPACVLSVSLVRHRSLRFDNKIAGTAWIDDVELKPAR